MRIPNSMLCRKLIFFKKPLIMVFKMKYINKNLSLLSLSPPSNEKEADSLKMRASLIKRCI